jgi:dolichyl-phosphate-mannose--protein O-mannosyl transferase
MTGPETGSTIATPASGTTRPRVSRRILALVVLVVALSAVVRFVDLGRYPDTVFDEHYYAHDAAVILHGDLAGSAAEPWKPAALRSAAHPDLAKLAIAAGIAVFGDNAWGWRVPAALAGVGLIALVFPIARRLGLSDEWALAALVLAASDPMLMLESRLGVLDMFVALATAAVVYLALRYVQSGFRVGWLVACGAAVGAAVACKWSGVLAVPAALVVLVPPVVGHGRGRVRPLPVIGALVLAPLVVYVAASLPYFAAGHGPADWLRLQEHMASFGWGVQGDRSFASRPLTWPFDAYPIWYKWSIGPDGASGLLAIGNFLLWWAGIAAWSVLGLLAILRRDWRLGMAPALVAALYLPWLLTTRQTYIYYMVPAIPFLAIVVATGLARLVDDPWAPAPGAVVGAVDLGAGEHRSRRLAAWAFCLASVIVGALYVPFVIGFPVPFDYYSFLTPFTTWK